MSQTSQTNQTNQTSPSPAHQMATGHLVLVLSLLLGLQPVTTDLYLPALPALTQALQVSVAQAQLTLSAALLAFGFGQLLLGPVSDKYGRKPVLLGGLLAYTLAAVASSTAGSLEALLIWRIVQGLGLGAAVVCARALVRDLYAPQQGAVLLSKGLSGLGIIACATVPLGALATHYFGWRTAFLVVAVFGAATLAAVALLFKESLLQPDAQALHPARMWRNWVKVLRNRRFQGFALLAGSSYCGLFTFLATSSFVMLEVLGLSRMTYGVIMSSQSLFYLSGTYLCRNLLQRWGLPNTVAAAGLLMLLAGLAMCTLYMAGVRHPLAILLPFFTYMIGHGVMNPCGQAGAVGPFPEAAGVASALSGFVMMVMAFAMGQWLGWLEDGTAAALVYGVTAASLATALVAWLMIWRIPQPAGKS